MKPSYPINILIHPATRQIEVGSTFAPLDRFLAKDFVLTVWRYDDEYFDFQLTFP